MRANEVLGTVELFEHRGTATERKSAVILSRIKLLIILSAVYLIILSALKLSVVKPFVVDLSAVILSVPFKFMIRSEVELNMYIDSSLHNHSF